MLGPTVPLQVTMPAFLEPVPTRLWLAVGVLLLGAILGVVVGKINRRLLKRAGVPEAIEGTAFERTAREFDSSTVTIVAKLSMYFILVLALFVALTVADIRFVSAFWGRVASFLPNLFVALLIVIVGIVVGDKVELLLSERLRGVKLPQISFLPTLAKYSVFYIAAIVALDQIGVAVFALAVGLAVYSIGIVIFGVVAGRDLLLSAAAGIYLLLEEPYGIGDEIRIGDEQGVVQEVEVFVTHIESEEEEYIIPNRQIFTDGIVRVRD